MCVLSEDFIEIAIWIVEGREERSISELDSVNENLLIGMYFNARVVHLKYCLFPTRLKIRDPEKRIESSAS